MRIRRADIARGARLTLAGALILLAVPPLAAQTAPPAGMSVTVVKAARTCFADRVQVSGHVVPRDEVLVRPDAEGLRVAQVLVEEGDAVTAGQVLARLSPPDPQATQGTRVSVQAPVPGIVSHKSVIIGVMASAKADPLFRIVANGEVELDVQIPAKYLPLVVAGQSATMEIIGVGAVTGKVRFVSLGLDPVTQLGQARLFIGNDQRLRVGAFGRANIEAGRSCGPSIPQSAILYGAEGAVVQVVRDDRIETRRVRVGLTAGNDAEIREGVSEGDTVVARAGAFLREGDRVRPVPRDEAAATARR